MSPMANGRVRRRDNARICSDAPRARSGARGPAEVCWLRGPVLADLPRKCSPQPLRLPRCLQRRHGSPQWFEAPQSGVRRLKVLPLPGQRYTGIFYCFATYVARASQPCVELPPVVRGGGGKGGCEVLAQGAGVAESAVGGDPSDGQVGGFEQPPGLVQAAGPIQAAGVIPVAARKARTKVRRLRCAWAASLSMVSGPSGPKPTQAAARSVVTRALRHRVLYVLRLPASRPASATGIASQAHKPRIGAPRPCGRATIKNQLRNGEMEHRHPVEGVHRDPHPLELGSSCGY